jgi:hypothetical protein
MQLAGSIPVGQTPHTEAGCSELWPGVRPDPEKLHARFPSIPRIGLGRKRLNRPKHGEFETEQTQDVPSERCS